MLAAQTFYALSQVFDCYNALNAFYVAHVRLGRESPTSPPTMMLFAYMYSDAATCAST